MKNDIFKGAVVLILSGFVCKILGAVYRIPLSNILGAEGIGIYQMIFPIFSLALIICSSGVCQNVAQNIAKARAGNNPNAKNIVLKGFLYSLVSSIVFSLILFLFAKQISILQGNILAQGGYKIIALALIFSSLLASFRGFFQGYQNMAPTAISQIIEQLFKVVLGLSLAYFLSKQSVELGVLGALLGIGIAEFFAFVYVFFKFIFFKKKSKEIVSENNLKHMQTLKANEKSNFWRQNFAYTISFLIIPLLTAFDSFVVINLLKNNFSESFSTALYGLQSGMVNSLINFPVIVSLSISMALLPSLTFLVTQGKMDEVKEKIEKIFMLIFIIIIPCQIVFLTLSPTIMGLIYPNLSASLFEISSLLLIFNAPQILFISFLQVCIAIFQSLNQEKTPIKIMFLCAIFKILLTLFLVSNPNLNIFGLAIANFIFYASGAILSLRLIKKQINFKLDLKILKITFLAGVNLSISFLVLNVLNLNILAKIILILIFSLFFYVLPFFIFKILSLKEIKTMIIRK